MDESTKISIIDSSILDDIKKYVGPSISYTVFDMDIIMNINAAFFTLFQLGVGSEHKVFTITDNQTTWSEFSINENIISAVKQYIYLKVRNVFDPPTSSYVLQAYDSQIQELEWRLRELAAGVFGDGTGDANMPQDVYELPIATTETLGAVIIGENVDVTEEGRISVDVVSEEEVKDMLDKVFGKEG